MNKSKFLEGESLTLTLNKFLSSQYILSECFNFSKLPNIINTAC